MAPLAIVLLTIQLAQMPDVPDGMTARLYVCDETRRPNRPHGNTLETDRAKLVINESFCRTT